MTCSKWIYLIKHWEVTLLLVSLFTLHSRYPYKKSARSRTFLFSSLMHCSMRLASSGWSSPEYSEHILTTAPSKVNLSFWLSEWCLSWAWWLLESLWCSCSSSCESFSSCSRNICSSICGTFFSKLPCARIISSSATLPETDLICR